MLYTSHLHKFSTGLDVAALRVTRRLSAKALNPLANYHYTMLDVGLWRNRFGQCPRIGVTQYIDASYQAIGSKSNYLLHLEMLEDILLHYEEINEKPHYCDMMMNKFYDTQDDLIFDHKVVTLETLSQRVGSKIHWDSDPKFLATQERPYGRICIELGFDPDLFFLTDERYHNAYDSN